MSWFRPLSPSPTRFSTNTSSDILAGPSAPNSSPTQPANTSEAACLPSSRSHACAILPTQRERSAASSSSLAASFFVAPGGTNGALSSFCADSTNRPNRVSTTAVLNRSRGAAESRFSLPVSGVLLPCCGCVLISTLFSQRVKTANTFAILWTSAGLKGCNSQSLWCRRASFALALATASTSTNESRCWIEATSCSSSSSDPDGRAPGSVFVAVLVAAAEALVDEVDLPFQGRSPRMLSSRKALYPSQK
mmetsp:Transcript_282/g.491  ORF Transcript_282/g.491 Transcript_282/m.491 type:complete len:249 (+) Transcript_282:1885-2631(+)